MNPNNQQQAAVPTYDPATRYNNPGAFDPVNTFTPGIYNPADRYNPPSTPPYGSSGGGSNNLSAGGILPNEIIGNPNIWRIAAILDGANNPTYTYTVTNTDITNAYFQIQFPHFLSYTPTVEGSFVSLANMKLRRPLPFVFTSNTNYFNKPPSAVMSIVAVDPTNIYIAASINDALGLSIFSSNYQLVFKFYCFQDGTVSQ